MDFDALRGVLLDHSARGEHAQALQRIDEHAPHLPPHAVTLEFWRACVLVRSGDPDAALRVLEDAVVDGAWYGSAMLRGDTDMESLQGIPAFERLARTCAERESRARRDGPTPPLVLAPTRGDDRPRWLVALHRAARSPQRCAAHWEAARRAGWAVLLPYGGQPLASDAHVWLDRDLARLDPAAGDRIAAALQPYGTVPGGGQDRPCVLAGFSQGAAMALQVGLRGLLQTAGVLLVGASPRYLDVLDELGGRGLAPDPPRVHVVAGQEERHVDAVRHTVGRLRALGVEATLEVRVGLGHTFPDGFADELPALLRDLSGS